MCTVYRVHNSRNMLMPVCIHVYNLRASWCRLCMWNFILNKKHYIQNLHFYCQIHTERKRNMKLWMLVCLVEDSRHCLVILYDVIIHSGRVAFFLKKSDFFENFSRKISTYIKLPILSVFHKVKMIKL